MLRLIVCLVMVPHIKAEFDSEAGCPDSTLFNPDFTFEFDRALIIHRNLGGRWCEEQAALGNVGAGCDDIDPATGEPIEEILYCNVGYVNDEGRNLNPDLCIRVVDVGRCIEQCQECQTSTDACLWAYDPDQSQDFSTFDCWVACTGSPDTDQVNTERFSCSSVANCGNVHDTSENIFGQIKYSMGGNAHMRAEFSTVECSNGDYLNCIPLYWDTMVMSFLDIDGGNLNMENIIFHDAFNYQIPALDEDGNPGFNSQDSYGSDWSTCRNDMDNPNRQCFTNMKLWFDDPNAVYTYLDSESGTAVLNTNVGDVTVSNFNSAQAGEANGNILNPTRLDNLDNDQLARSVSGVWVSEANMIIAQNLVNGRDTEPWEYAGTTKRYSFQVSLGKTKRTVLFAGWSRSIGGDICQGCRRAYLNNNPCNPGDVSYPDRVCYYESQSITSGCNYDTCCSAGSSSHGDPVIWTFHDECYDLNKDGLWLASSHPLYDHQVKIAVYNDYMRELQVLTKSGDLLLSITNMGEVVNNNFPYSFTQELLPCPDDMDECIHEYMEFKFDIQDFQYVVQTLRHAYLDPALSDGENGYHLDIYPKTYGGFGSNKNGYSGLYFENPLPEELEYCPGDSLRAGRGGLSY